MWVLVHEVGRPVHVVRRMEYAARDSRRGAAWPRGESIPGADQSAPALADIQADQFQRLPVGFDELARVLGGGIVPGSVVLIGGDPGIGKSTLLLQVSAQLAASIGPVLYVSAEESAQQIKMRADRLGLAQPNLYVVSRCRSTRSWLTSSRSTLAWWSSIRSRPFPQRSSNRQPGALARSKSAPARCCAWPRPTACRFSWSATSPRPAPSPARACSSTSSMRCSTWKASGFTPIACCEA